MPVQASASTLVRIPPMAGELTGSWFRRMATPYGLPAQDLLRGILSGAHRVQVTGTPGSGLELFLNTPARTALAQSTGLPLTRLTRLLPALAAPHGRLADDENPRAAWHMPGEAWVGTCPACTGRAWRPGQPVLVYPGTAGHVCQRHRRWLLAHPGRPASISLETLPEVLTAHRHHSALARARPDAADVVALAAAVVWSWQVQGWRSETVWQDRVRRLAAVTGSVPTAVVPHALVSYPETIAVARLLGAPHWQQRLRETASAKGAGAATELLLREISRRADRPWLADWLIAYTRTRPRTAAQTDPLDRWLRRLTAADGTESDGLWTVHRAAVRPTEYSDRVGFLTDRRPRSLSEEAGAAFLTGGWEPVPSPQPGPAPCP
ncbi:TniQ family protein [Streptomyces phaeochromogenes]|uniref:TniQ family protein n=1 Tax=Streptomyces phaeochromogenes TaxID=1923 RepID=UPI002DDBB132|nr:TniQ family protein [Streptomyces phaeochromogenes]WRZ26302.1 TniQ family protein [Streptomyces phaeochromogenes]